MFFLSDFGEIEDPSSSITIEDGYCTDLSDASIIIDLNSMAEDEIQDGYTSTLLEVLQVSRSACLLMVINTHISII